MSEHHTLMYIPISMVPAVHSIIPGPNGEPARCVVVPREPIIAYQAALERRRVARQDHGIDSGQMADATDDLIETRREVLKAALAAAVEQAAKEAGV